MPFERVAEQESKFDIVWSAAFLHHVLDRLDDVAAQLLRNTRQDGRLIVLEPIRKSSLLKRIRAVIPPYPTGTPDERPLENEDFAKLTKIFATQSLRYFGPISRIAVRAMQSEKYETAGYLKRTVADSMHRLDKIVVNHTPLRRSAMVVVGSLTPRHS
jgi:SAM-dependent methyltransferase